MDIEVMDPMDDDNSQQSNGNDSKIDPLVEGDADSLKDVDGDRDHDQNPVPIFTPHSPPIRFTRSKNPVNVNLKSLPTPVLTLERLKVEDGDPDPTMWSTRRSSSRYRNQKLRLKSKSNENDSENKNRNTTKDCIICGVTVATKVTNSVSKNERLVRASGLVQLLHLPQIPFFQDFRSSQFCVDCHQNILQVVEEFGMLERIQEQVSRRKEEVKTLVKANYQRVTRSKSRSSKDSDSYVGVVGRIFHEIGSQSDMETDTEESIPRSKRGRKSKVTAKRVRKVKVRVNEDRDEPSPSRRRGHKRKINAEAEITSSKKISPYDGSVVVEVKAEVTDADLLETEYRGDPELDLDLDCEDFQVPPLSDNFFDDNVNESEPEPEDKPKRRGRPRKLTSSSEVKVHKKRGKPPLYRPYECFVEGCLKTFTSDGKLQQHDQTAHGGIRPNNNTIYKCEICGKIYSSSIALYQHRKTKHNVTTIDHRCSNCSMKFQTQTELDAHVLLHSQESSHFTCIICSTIFSNSIDLKTHMKMNHLDSVGPADQILGNFKCKTCGKSCKTKKGLLHHKLRHTGDLPFKCTVVIPGQGQCPYGFPTQSQLENHMISHSESKMFQCDICGKELKYKNGLSRHRRKHEALKETGRLRYACKVCPKTFNENYGLKRHEEIHSKINSYVCEVCGKTFWAHNNYYIHSKIHKRKLGLLKPKPSKSKSTTQTQNNLTENENMIANSS